MVRITALPDIASAVYHGFKATNQSILCEDVNECSNICIPLNIRIRFLNSNIRISYLPRAVLLLSFQMKNYTPAMKGGSDNLAS